MLTFVSFVSALSILIPLTIGALNYKYLTRELKILGLFFVFGAAIDSLSWYYSFVGVPNLWLFHLYTLVEFSVLMYVMSLWMGEGLQRRLLQLSVLCFSILWLISKVTFESIQRFDSFTASFSNLLLVLAGVYLIQQFSVGLFRTTLVNPKFWICASILLYYSVNLVLIAVGNLVYVRWLQSVINVLANILYAIGFACSRLQSKLNGPS